MAGKFNKVTFKMLSLINVYCSFYEGKQNVYVWKKCELKWKKNTLYY